jgi:hypothetical protein
MISRLNGAKLNLAMRDMLPVKIGKNIFHVDSWLHNALTDVLNLTGNSSVDTIEYFDELKKQINRIQKGLKEL